VITQSVWKTENCKTAHLDFGLHIKQVLITSAFKKCQTKRIGLWQSQSLPK